MNLSLVSQVFLTRIAGLQSMDCLFVFNVLLRYCDEGMSEAVTTLIWAAPRLQTDIQELRVVCSRYQVVVTCVFV